MIHLIHGADIVASRKYVTDLIGEKPHVYLDGKTLSMVLLEEHLLSTGLFDDEKVVVIENFFSKNKKKKDYVLYFNNSISADVIFWEDDKVTKTAFAKIEKLIIKEFEMPQYYFTFLDNFVPGKNKYIYELYHKLLASSTPEIVYYSLLKRMRQLIAIHQNAITSYPDTAKLADWQLKKLVTQAKMWNGVKLETFYDKLATLEIKMKSGALPLGISKHLDILILSEI